MSQEVMLCNELSHNALQKVLDPYGIQIIWIEADKDLPGSFWGDPEAGLIANQLYLRPTTPVQSALHEACHYICMDSQRRASLHTDAGGGYDEENSVCYLQILLAERLTGMGARRMMQDMDAWGYSFRLGSSRAWFEKDAEDARTWLQQQALINDDENPTGRLRA